MLRSGAVPNIYLTLFEAWGQRFWALPAVFLIWNKGNGQEHGINPEPFEGFNRDT